MVRTRTILSISTLGILTALTGCPEDKPAAPPAAPTATPPPAPVAPAAPTAAAPAAPAAPNAPAAPAAAPGATGTVKGTVAFAGSAPEMPALKREADAFCGKTKMKDETVLVKNGVLQNVVVRVANVAGTFAPPATEAAVSQDNCMYRPRVQGVLAGQSVSIKNGDPAMHNVHTYKGAASWFNQAQLAGSPAIVKKFPDSSVVVKFKCDVHPWMTGYVAVNQNPFFAVTGEDGTFEIKDVPAGKYTVEAWHEKLGTKTAEVTVAPGAPAETKFEFKE